MAYTPINWQTGDTITAEKLNKCDNGWGVETTSTTIFNGSVTTEEHRGVYMGQIALTGTLSLAIGSEATITFNGTTYSCTCFDDDGYPTYGGAYGDFTTYPFSISYSDGDDMYLIVTENGGTYTIKIEVPSEIVEVSDNFRTAVSEAVDPNMLPMECVSGTTTYTQMNDACTAGRILFFKPYSRTTRFITNFDSSRIVFYPTDSTLLVEFDGNNIFTVSTV